MKKTVAQFVSDFGASTRYSGKTSTMFVIGRSSYDAEFIERMVLNKFGFSLPFKLASNYLNI